MAQAAFSAPVTSRVRVSCVTVTASVKPAMVGVKVVVLLVRVCVTAVSLQTNAPSTNSLKTINGCRVGTGHTSTCETAESFGVAAT